MIAPRQDDETVVPIGIPKGQPEKLPYCVELWQAEDGGAIERVLARASSAILARAIFKAAGDSHPGRRITLRRGSHIVADSAE